MFFSKTSFSTEEAEVLKCSELEANFDVNLN